MSKIAPNPTMYAVGGDVQASGGVYIPRKADDDLLALCRAGTFSFSNFTTSQPNSPSFGSWGHSFASFLLGDVSSTSTVIPVETALTLDRYALFAQDEWRATPQLTVIAGLRHDRQWFDENPLGLPNR